MAVYTRRVQGVYTRPQTSGSYIRGGIGHNRPPGSRRPIARNPGAPNYTVHLPSMHSDQVKAWEMKVDFRTLIPGYVDPETGVSGEAWLQNSGGRFRVIRAGRRWGKTASAIIEAVEAAAAGKLVGWFAPDFKTLAEAYGEIASALEPMKRSANKDKYIRTKTRGKIEFWSLEKIDAGRSRKYDFVVIDEAAFGPPTTMQTWERAIKPTLTDRFGRCLVVSNTKGALPDNFIYEICKDPKHGFICFEAPTANNPTIPESWGPEEERRAVEALGPDATVQEKRDWLRHDELALLKRRSNPLVFAQEHEAKFVDWSGEDFFDMERMLVDGKGVPIPDHCDQVFATIDTATKTGTKNDGTAICYWARNKYTGHKLILLDWEIIQIQGDLLDTWMIPVFDNLQHWAERTGAREGSRGAWIEDKNSGSVLIQTLLRAQKPAQAIPSVLTAMGKDERAIAVSAYVYRGEVKVSQEALDKRTLYKGQTLNHFNLQVSKFRIGGENKQGDDLLDTFTYGIIISLGNAYGF